eukprot:CCRYP_009711-RA/>CCRYP_009711-RA protein AED:0.25 eAED:0.25 QI:0/-1/0/1/-1/1/1/0/112
MARYISHFWSVQLRTLLRVANVTEDQLPLLPKYTSGGKNNLCYAYVLGKCQGKMCGKSPEGHAPVGEITDVFARTLCEKLGPAIEKHLAMEPPTVQHHFSGSYSGKRYKRTA